MALRIYNTLTRQKEDFETLEPGKVSMYVCGPTVYSKAHVGHAMSALIFDIIRRYLEFRGYQVRYVMNYTDVDDKIISRAQEEGRDPFELAEGYIQEFQSNLKALNVQPATVTPRATQEIEYITRMIQELGEEGYAYHADGDVYFRVTRDEDYGKLSKRRLDDMQAGARIEVDERKEHPMDFALWKQAKPGEPAWDSPWGKGRPGWHIECSAMNLHHHGEQIDIHGGGNDLIFPHHENEIAQTESLTGKPFARYWVHNGMMQLGGEKMSKSLGNLVTIEDFLAENDAAVLRIMVLNSSYRNPLTFTDEVVEQSRKALERMRSALRPAVTAQNQETKEAQETLSRQMEITRQGFLDCMDDDFNTAGALGHLFELVRAINQARDAGVNAQNLEEAQQLLISLTSVLGLTLENAPTVGGEAAPFIDLLVEMRGELRKQKLWALSDQIRDRLNTLGIVIEDTKEGSIWRWI
jgi:cysteinyl-tRNA synthetase